MKKQLIIYGSQYGSTKRYAERLAKMTGIPVVIAGSRQQVADSSYRLPATGYSWGGIFAGGVLGLRKTAAKMNSRQELVIATVGVTDPQESAYFKSIRQSIKAQLPEGLYNEDNVFHLRGAIDYSHLSFGHNLMMKQVAGSW